MSKQEHAAKALVQTFRANDRIPLDWLYAALELAMPTDQMLYGKANHLQQRFLQGMKLLRRELSSRYGVMLATVTDERCRDLLPTIIRENDTIALAFMIKGYRWVHPDRQAEVRRKNVAWRLRHTLANMAARLTHINWDALTHEERQHHCRVVMQYRRWRRLLADTFGVEGPGVPLPEI